MLVGPAYENGTSRHFVATQQFCRFRSEADIQRAAIAESARGEDSDFYSLLFSETRCAGLGIIKEINERIFENA
jgi:hypothetical protein